MAQRHLVTVCSTGSSPVIAALNLHGAMVSARCLYHRGFQFESGCRYRLKINNIARRVLVLRKAHILSLPKFDS